MKTYRVIIKEINRYSLEVFAKDEDEAVAKVYHYPDFMDSIPVASTSEVEEVFEEVFEDEEE